MTKKIAFIVQNETHAQNAKILYDAIKDKHSDFKPFIILMDGMTGQNNQKYVCGRNIRELECFLEIPFQRLSRLAQLKAMHSLRHELASLVLDIDILVFGNDGAPERLMAKKIQQKAGRVVMLCDGFLTPWTDHSWQKLFNIIKREFLGTLRRFIPTYFLPNFIGHSKMNLICVMSERVAEALRCQGVKTPIEVVMLPRYASLLEAVLQIKEKTPKTEKINILYATGAWTWHRASNEERFQQKDVEDLSIWATNHGDNVCIKIRIHPRDEIDNYGGFEQTENFIIGTSSTSIDEDLAWADCLLTARSSMLQEAALVGVPRFVYAKNFPTPAKDNIPISPENYKIISNLRELLACKTKGSSNLKEQQVNYKNALELILCSNVVVT